MTYQTLFFVMLVVWFLSLAYPWSSTWPLARFLVHSPILLLLLWGRYEQVMPAGMNIRVDLLLIIPALLISFVIYAGRLIVFALNRKNRP